MIRTIRKALMAAGVGLAGALGTALLDGEVTSTEVLASVGVGLLAGVATYKIKNEPPAPGQ